MTTTTPTLLPSPTCPTTSRWDPCLCAFRAGSVPTPGRYPARTRPPANLGALFARALSGSGRDGRPYPPSVAIEMIRP